MQTTVRHRLIDTSKEIIEMLAEDNPTFKNFPKQYVSIYDIEVSYDEVKRIEALRI